MPHLLNVTKGLGANEKWTGDLDGKVYQEKEPGKPLVQVGFVDKHWITLQNGQRIGIPVVMSKGVEKGAKWCGEKDGIIYIER